MKIRKKKIASMIGTLDSVLKKSRKLEKKYQKHLSATHPSFKNSATNLLHYLALRHTEIRDLQTQLGEMGVSRLGKAESHVQASVLAVKDILKKFTKTGDQSTATPLVSIKQGRKTITRNTNTLLGKKLKGSYVRIMVTLPSEAADDRHLISDLLKAGMNCARINCAHDDPQVWEKMIDKIRAARKRTGRNCKICMDLGGPKLRTGAMIPGPKVIHLSPGRDDLGRVVLPAQALLARADKPVEELDIPVIPVEGPWLRKLRKGDIIQFSDTRKKRCQLIVGINKYGGKLVTCSDSAYLMTGTSLIIKSTSAANGSRSTVGDILPTEQKIILNIGDTLILHKDENPGEGATYDERGNLLSPAHISCTAPEIFEDIKPGEPVLLDDGKIETEIFKVNMEQVELKVTYAREGGAKLKADKGINLPQSKLRMRGLTTRDKEDIKFLARYADVVNMSFVNSPADVTDLLKLLAELKADHLGIILKIETRSGYKNLPAILLAAMQRHPIGVMIARGDLAIEAGWKNLAQIQEEIMWLCEAAHVPIVWATQVLETLAKKGLPSRAEITDAAMAQRAECVMLNKGPHIVRTIKMLDEIMQGMQEYHVKQAPMIPVMKSSNYLNI